MIDVHNGILRILLVVAHELVISIDLVVGAHQCSQHQQTQGYPQEGRHYVENIINIKVGNNFGRS